MCGRFSRGCSRPRAASSRSCDGLRASSCTDWPLEQLQMADAEFAESVSTLRLLLGNGHCMNVRVWPGYEEPRDGGTQCLSASSGCEQHCPFFGESICEKYVIGIGRPWGDAAIDNRKSTE